MRYVVGGKKKEKNGPGSNSGEISEYKGANSKRGILNLVKKQRKRCDEL